MINFFIHFIDLHGDIQMAYRRFIGSIFIREPEKHQLFGDHVILPGYGDVMRRLVLERFHLNVIMVRANFGVHRLAFWMRCIYCRRGYKALGSVPELANDATGFRVTSSEPLCECCE